MPPPPADASPAWRRARLTRIIEEVAARVPMDAAQGHLAGQLVVVQFLADDMVGRITAPGLPLAERRLVARTADDLLRSVVRLERALERRQARVMPFRDVGAVGGFDLAALDGVWCRGVPVAAGTGSRAAAGTDSGSFAAACAGDAAAGTVPPPAAPAPEAGLAPGAPASAGAEGAAAWVGRAAAGRPGGGAGEAAGAGDPDGRAGVARACVTLEQGDGWSLEVWPARAGASVAPDPAAHDRLAWPGATVGAATAERAATERPGPRGVA